MFLFLLITFIGLSFDRLNIFKYCVISCLIHEAGHIMAHKIYSGKWPVISVSLFGFRMENNVILNKHFAAILFAGPLMNLICAVIGAIHINFAFTLDSYIFTVVNSFIFAFNILPVYYLDGGQIFYSKSAFYQKNYNRISVCALLLICVMLYSFTDNLLCFMLPIIYYIINIINDI